MQHRYNLYVNQGERRIPSLIEQGEVDLRCSNPSAEQYRQQYDAERLWRYLQSESDMSQRGLYLSLTCTERPTYDGKRWFIHTAYNEQTGGLTQSRTLEVRWINIKDIQFWNSSFRDYARIHQGRGIVDYTVYVSRCFGYAFMMGSRYDDDEDDERGDFTTFYPSIHHYHRAVAINEQETYQMFNDEMHWFPKNYSSNGEIEGSNADSVVVDEGQGIASAVERATASMRSWENVITNTEENSLDLSNLLQASEEMLEDVEEPIEDEADSEELIDLGDDIMEEEED